MVKGNNLNNVNYSKMNSWDAFQDKIEEIQNKFRVNVIASKEDTDALSGLKEGTIYKRDPIPTTTADAYHLLTNYYGVVYCELNKHLFLEDFKVWKPDLIEAEIKEIKRFIERAEKENVKEAYKSYGKSNDKNEFVYLRLLHGFYEDLELERYPLINSIGNPEAVVYGRYFLFYNFLQEQVNVSAKKDFNDLKNNENDYLRSTIEDYLFEFKEKFNNEHEYNKAVDAIKRFIQNKDSGDVKEIFVRSGNKKRLAYALGEIFRSQRNQTISIDYLRFARATFSIFKDEKFDEQQLNKSNLYKYLTSKT